MIEVKFVKTDDRAILPTRNHGNIEKGVTDKLDIIDGTHDSGFDLYAIDEVSIPPSECRVVPVGLKVGYITPGYWFRIESRSGLSFKNGILAHPGIIDNQYRGDLGVNMYNHGSERYYTVKPGDKIAQMVLYPLIDCKVSFTDKVTETIRAEKGHGSSGR